MKMTIKEFEEKVEKIDELTLEHNPEYNTYQWIIKTENYDIRKHLEKQLGENLILTDAYKLPPHYYNAIPRMWIKKETIDNVIKNINESESYQDIVNYLREKPFTKDIKIYRSNDMDKRIEIKFDEEWDDQHREIGEFIRKQCEKISNISWKYDNYRWWELSVKTIDEKENCKHKCKTDYRIGKIDEILRI